MRFQNDLCDCLGEFCVLTGKITSSYLNFSKSLDIISALITGSKCIPVGMVRFLHIINILLTVVYTVCSFYR